MTLNYRDLRFSAEDRETSPVLASDAALERPTQSDPSELAFEHPALSPMRLSAIIEP